jgi:hypothetical protein
MTIGEGVTSETPLGEPHDLRGDARFCPSSSDKRRDLAVFCEPFQGRFEGETLFSPLQIFGSGESECLPPFRVGC